jgi:uncharacterized protein YgiB involved in biofilm formation
VKRTRKLVLTGLMTVGGLSLCACDSGDVGSNNPSDVPRATNAYVYSSLQACLDKNDAPDSACEASARNAISDDQKAATWPDQASCEVVYGEGQCTPPSSASGHDTSWGPLLMGLVMGRTLEGGWGGRALYRDWRRGSYYTAGGGRIWTDYPTGHLRISQRSFDPPDYRRGPEQTLCRSQALSRGGFGGRMSSHGCDGEGSWGG